MKSAALTHWAMGRRAAVSAYRTAAANAQAAGEQRQSRHQAGNAAHQLAPNHGIAQVAPGHDQNEDGDQRRLDPKGLRHGRIVATARNPNKDTPMPNDLSLHFWRAVGRTEQECDAEVDRCLDVSEALRVASGHASSMTEAQKIEERAEAWLARAHLVRIMFASLSTPRGN